MRKVPRFGHSSDFADMFATPEEKQDYITGLLFAGVFLFVFFFVWSALLVFFKCFGTRRGGFLSGGSFIDPSSSESQTPSRCGPRFARTIFILSTVVLIVFSVLFVTNGLTNLRNSVVTVVKSSRVRTVNIFFSHLSLDITPQLTPYSVYYHTMQTHTHIEHQSSSR